MIRPLALAMLLAATACSTPAPALESATDFAVDDDALAAAVSDAAAEWARAGLEVASYATVNQFGGGVPVRARPRAELLAHCNLTPEHRATWTGSELDGCAEHHRGHHDGIWLADDLSPERRAVVLRHELIHVLVPDAEHVVGVGVFSAGGTSSTIADADLDELARHTTVIRDAVLQ